MKQQLEYQLQVSVCDYLRLQYPRVFFLSDTIASVKLTPQQAVRNKQIQCPDFHAPDLMIFARRFNFAGLAFELKSECPFRRDGKLKQNAHLEAQALTHKRLRLEGWLVSFEWRFEAIKAQIDGYLRGRGRVNEHLRPL